MLWFEVIIIDSFIQIESIACNINKNSISIHSTALLTRLFESIFNNDVAQSYSLQKYEILHSEIDLREKQSFEKCVQSLCSCLGSTVCLSWLRTAWVVIVWLKRVGFSVAADAPLQSIGLTSRHFIFLFNHKVVILGFGTLNIGGDQRIVLSERQSIITRYVSASFYFSITFLPWNLIPWLKRVSMSFLLTLIEILSSIDIFDIPEIVRCPISYKSFSCRFDLILYLIFGIDNFTWFFYSIGKSLFFSDSFDILKIDKSSTSMAILSRINLGD